MTIITSRDNQKLKFARSVRDGKEPLFVFIEGARLAVEVVRAALPVTEVFISESFERKEENARLVDDLSSPDRLPLLVADRLFPSIADTKNPQGIVVIAKKPEFSLERIERAITGRSSTIPVVVFLNEINNPSNLGAIFRTAEAAGAAGVIISPESADAFSTKAVRSAMGSNFRLPVCENMPLDGALAWARERNLVSAAADIHGDARYAEIDWKAPHLLIFGSEAHGLKDDDRQKIDEIITIPMENGVESLNLAVSCGIVLFEARRQQFL